MHDHKKSLKKKFEELSATHLEGKENSVKKSVNSEIKRFRNKREYARSGSSKHRAITSGKKPFEEED